MYILASVERSFKFRLNDTRLLLTHSVIIKKFRIFVKIYFLKFVHDIKTKNKFQKSFCLYFLKMFRNLDSVHIFIFFRHCHIKKIIKNISKEIFEL